jgi:hypothetical protein
LLHPGADERRRLAEKEQAGVSRIQCSHEELEIFCLDAHESQYGYGKRLERPESGSKIDQKAAEV